MSTFNAINLAPKDEQIEAEDHTRELQVEEGFKFYEDALKAMNGNNFEEANAKFEQLFALDILKPDKWGLYRYKSPTLDRLRYLSYRNRAMYYYFYLIESYDEEMESPELVNDILKVMENLMESLQHAEADSTVTSILVEIFKSFKSKKLERLTLEYEVNKKENELLLLGRRKLTGLLPSLSRMVAEYQELLVGMQDDQSQQNNHYKGLRKANGLKYNHELINSKFKASLNRIHKLKGEDEITMKKLDITSIELDEATWDCFAKAVKSQLPYVKMTILLGRNSDPYSEIEYPIEGMTFDFKKIEAVAKDSTGSNISSIEITDEGVSKEETIDDKNKDGNENDVKTNKRGAETIETPKQRSSKRFKAKDPQETHNTSLVPDKMHSLFYMELKIEYENMGCKMPTAYDELNFDNTSSDSIAIIYSDIYHCLKTWNSWHADIFQKNDQKGKTISESDENDVFKLNALLRNDLSNNDTNMNSKFEPLPNTRLVELVSKINNNPLHFHEIRFLLLEYLLNLNDGQRFTIEYIWSEDMYKIIQDIVLSIESNLYEYIAQDLGSKWYMGLSIYEILVNILGQLSEEIISKNIHKNRVSDLKTQRNKVERKINRLYSLLITHKCTDEQQISLQWVYYTYLQYMNDVIGDVAVQVLSEIVELSGRLLSEITIKYPNYGYIQSLSTKDVALYLKRINAIKSFTIVDLDNINQESENIKNLEQILLHDLDTTIECGYLDADMVNFISNAPFSLKFKLWNVLFTYYFKREDILSLKRTYLNLSSLLLSRLTSKEYHSGDDEFRANMLLSTLSILGNIAERLARFMEISHWKFDRFSVTDSFIDRPHVTHEKPMDRPVALTLGIYLLKLQYQHMNPLLFNGNKNVLKQVFDNIVEAIGDVATSEKYVITRNHYLLKESLHQPITISHIKKCLRGEVKLNLSLPGDELQEAIDAGIFYVSSIQALHQYIQRKKMMQARPSELDFIIKNITIDLLYNTKRFESWYILGQCYSYIVEDDLIWTSDKLASKDKKNTIADAQRRAILCYLMSLSLLYAKEKHMQDDFIILKMILESLGKELTIAYYKPMSKACFEWKYNDPSLMLCANLEVEKMKTAPTLTLSDFNIQQLILLSFSRAVELEQNELVHDERVAKTWLSYYNIAKLLFKYNRKSSVNTIVDNIKTACKNAIPLSEPKDFIIEPHYTLITMCYKLVKESIITIKTATEILRENSIFKQLLIDNASDTKSFYTQIRTLLEYLISLDRKNWHHRPQYRLARLYFEEFGDYQTALIYMEKFVSVRNNKSLVNIWKPDYERPGKHFVYTHQYVIFFVDLMLRKGDFNSIAIIIRKIKRFGSAIAYVNETIEYSIKRYIECVYQRLDVNDKYIENLLPDLCYTEFLSVSEDLGKSFNVSYYPEEYTEGLKLAFQLKRSSNGITFDGPCLAIYFKIFFLPAVKSKEATITDNLTPLVTSTVSNSPAYMASPSTQRQTSDTSKNISSRKRVSKKEAFDRVKVITEKVPSV
ncbi:Histone transcription regulator 3 [Monosporozyma unispora]|nr:Histone transcription regulator 3 [Kazachstania unispora]